MALAPLGADLRTLQTQLGVRSAPGTAAVAAVYAAKARALRRFAVQARAIPGAPGNVTALLVLFDRAVLATRTAAVQKAEIAAIRGYNAHSARLTRLAEAVSRERLRLAKSLH